MYVNALFEYLTYVKVNQVAEDDHERATPTPWA